MLSLTMTTMALIGRCNSLFFTRFKNLPIGVLFLDHNKKWVRFTESSGKIKESCHKTVSRIVIFSGKNREEKLFNIQGRSGEIKHPMASQEKFRSWASKASQCLLFYYTSNWRKLIFKFFVIELDRFL